MIVGSESELHEYKVSKDTWYALCEHEIPVTDFALVVYRSQLLLVGGVITTVTPSKCQIVNVVSGAITTPPPSRTQEATCAIWHLDDKLGWVPVKSPLSPMPSCRSDAAAAADGDLLVVASGPGIVETNGVDVFDGKIWQQTVYVDGPMYYHPNQYSYKKSRLDMTIHDGDLCLLSEYSHQGDSFRFFGSVSIQSLLGRTQRHPCWKEIQYPDGVVHVSNPCSYNGHFISVVPHIHESKRTLSVFVYSADSWTKEIGVYMPVAIASPYIVTLPMQELMVIVGGEVFVISVVGKHYNQISSHYNIYRM